MHRIQDTMRLEGELKKEQKKLQHIRERLYRMHNSGADVSITDLQDVEEMEKNIQKVIDKLQKELVALKQNQD